MEFRPRKWISGEVEVEVGKTSRIQKNLLSSKSSGGEGIELEASLPTLFSREEGSSNSVSKMRDFFTKAGGSIAVSEALCITHRVDIRKEKQFHQIFIKLFTIPKREGYKVENVPPRSSFYFVFLRKMLALCFTCYLSDKATKVFTETFVESVKTLYAASLAGKEMRLKAFKHFVNEFGKDLNIFCHRP